MSFDDLVRNGVALAHSLTGSLQAAVRHEAWIADDGLGGSTYAALISRTALIESKQRMRHSIGGQEIVVDHVVSFLTPVAANGAAGRREPFDPRDQLILPSGIVCGIVAVEGLVDPDASGANYFYQVYLRGGGSYSPAPSGVLDFSSARSSGYVALLEDV